MIARYARWLHTGWPAGTVEKLPQVDADAGTNLPGVLIVGDLTGTPLLKFALESGARAARRVAVELGAGSGDRSPGALDLVVLGAGVSGVAAAIEARSRGLSCEVIEAEQPFSTLVDLPARKPIFTYPSSFVPDSALQVSAEVKEDLVAELRAQAERAGIVPRAGRAVRLAREAGMWRVHLADGSELRARRVIVAIGRSGDFRALGVPGETLAHVFHRLHDPSAYAGKRVVVVGGGDTAAEAAIALTEGGAQVALVHRGRELVRPKPENLGRLERLARAPEPGAGAGRLELRTGTQLRRILPDRVELSIDPGRSEEVLADVVFVMIGREPPLELLRRSGIAIRGEWSPAAGIGFAAFLAFCVWLYDWKSGGRFAAFWQARRWFPFNLPELLGAAGGAIAAASHDPRTLIGTLAISAAAPAFWYTLAYSVVVTVFGVRRIRRRRTPYVTAQTATLIAIQVLPLFLIPEVALPLLHHHELLPLGLADALFPAAGYGHGREFWRAYGLILAWPLNVYNVFTPEPLGWWLAIAFVQTFVLIPIAIFAFGKGVYCGWICSCGALAETLGDRHRHKMPHGPGWNRLNLAGQAILGIAVALLLVRVTGWVLPEGNWADVWFDRFKEQYKWSIDVFLAGVLGYGTYFWWSGRVWCRFFCPLAALMHVYARFSRFAILPEKKRCISCNLCTASCHQGIDVMSFAQRGLPMIDPQCVRCSACVAVCPTGTLQFGQVAGDGRPIALDRLAASPVLMREKLAPSPPGH